MKKTGLNFSKSGIGARIIATLACAIIALWVGGAFAQPQVQNQPASPKAKSGTVDRIDLTQLTAVSRAFGNFKGWFVPIPGNRGIATPTIHDGMVFIGGGYGSYEFYAFDALTGNAWWGVKVNDDGPTASVADDGRVAFNTESCTLFVLDSKTGKMTWSKWLGDPLMSQPALSEGRLFMCYPEGGKHFLASFDVATGKPFWKTEIPADVISAPVCEGDSVYLTTFDGTVARIRQADGKVVWKDLKPGTSAPWVAGNVVYVTMREERATSDAKTPGKKKTIYEGIGTLDKETGKNLHKELLARREAEYLSPEYQRRSSYQKANQAADSSVGFSTGPAAAKLEKGAANVGQSTVRGQWEFQGSRVSGSQGGLFNGMGTSVQSFDEKTGKILWKREIKRKNRDAGGVFFTPAAMAGEKIVVGTSDGDVLCFDRKSGKTLWSINVSKEAIRFQPSLWKGRVYVGTSDGKLVCIDTGDATLDGWTMWGGACGHNGAQR